MSDYITNRDACIMGPRGHLLEASRIEGAICRTREIMEKVQDFEVDIISILGMRNLSSFVGEVFAASMVKEFPSILGKNPHQDGYPDLLLLDGVGNDNWSSLAGRLREKGPFSPFATGGFEIKATCGSVPTPAQCARKHRDKPGLGDARVDLLTKYDWKAHHRETNYLFGLVWDFIDCIPEIVAVFYSSCLATPDWGSIIKPTDGGGRTTSVSIMTRKGVEKMYSGWVTVINEDSYMSFFDWYNCGTLLSDYCKKGR